MHSEIYMQRCIDLALNGAGNVAPNPMVGAVIVQNEKIIGEGWHRKFGDAHAEVNAVNSVADKKLLAQSTLYVSLEPCNHFGKTPPCVDLILKHKIPQVVIGSRDTNSEVNGNGIDKLKSAGVEVITGILEKECLELNKRFFYFQKTKLPYIILKWAQSQDGFIGVKEHGNVAISNEYSRQLVHKWRSEESSILVGTNTAALDNPSLDVREYSGNNPLRLVIDWNTKLSPKLQLFDSKIHTLVFTRKNPLAKPNLEYLTITESPDDLKNILTFLAERNIQSVFVEGGSKLLQSFIDKGLWNEARIFTSDKKLEAGVSAPLLKAKTGKLLKIKNDTLVVLKNDKN